MAAKNLKQVEYITLATVAKELDKSQRTVQRWAQTGRIDAYNFFGRLLVEREYFERWKARTGIKRVVR
jgi:excisionase family DNA binding protein